MNLKNQTRPVCRDLSSRPAGSLVLILAYFYIISKGSTTGPSSYSVFLYPFRDTRTREDVYREAIAAKFFYPSWSLANLPGFPAKRRNAKISPRGVLPAPCPSSSQKPQNPRLPPFASTRLLCTLACTGEPLVPHE